MTKTFRNLLGGVSAVALGLGVSTTFAADIIDKRIEEAHTGRVLSGTMGVYYGYSYGINTDDSDSLDSYTSLGGSAKADIPFNDNVGIQLDIYGEGNLTNVTQSEDYVAGFLAGVHLNYREPGEYLYGVFAGTGTVSNAESSSGVAQQFLAGVEGQYHMADWTFYGQGGITDIESSSTNSDWAENAWFARGVVRKYFNGGDGKLQADALFIAGDISDDEFQGWTWGVEAEHLLKDYGNGFVAGFVRYEGYNFDEDLTGGGGDSSSAHVVKVGIKVNWGYSNPMMRDHYGAGVDFADMSRVHSLIRALE